MLGLAHGTHEALRYMCRQQPAKLFIRSAKRPRVLSQTFYTTCLIPTFLSLPPSSIVMIFYPSILYLALLQLPSATARSFTVVNTCTYTIWYAPIYLVTLSRRIPRRSDLSLAVMQACSKSIPAIPAFHVSQTHFQIYTDLSAGDNVPQFPTGRVSNIFSFWQSHSCTYIDGSLPLRPPLSFQSRITGNLAEYGFASSHLSPTP